MKRNDARSIYQQSSISTASTTQFMIMLLEACLRFLENGETAICENNLVEKNDNLQKAQQIVLEIIPLVDQSVEAGNQLATFCEFLNRRMLEANMTDNQEIIIEVKEYIKELILAWRESSKRKTKKRNQGDSV